MHKRLAWLDIAKGFTILTILIGHMVLFSPNLPPYIIFALPLFFLVAGFNSYNSIERRQDPSFKGRLKSCASFMFFYVICTALASVFWDQDISLGNIWKRTLKFNALEPLYFCAIFLQVNLLGGFLYRIVNRSKRYGKYQFWYCAALLVLTWVFSSQVLNRVVLYPDYQGGVLRLLGGTYLFTVVFGMVYALYYETILRYRRIVLPAAVALVLFSMVFLVSRAWSNPPNVYATLYSIAAFTVFSLVPFSGKGWVQRFFVLLGKNSIHIFMYHMLVVLIFAYFDVNIYVIFVLAMILPILLGQILDRLWLVTRSGVLKLAGTLRKPSRAAV